ncbi:MAG: exosortase/archaeosortase family protein [Verrucomicrobiae bacterium]|nr:exosortase/archaeosortase family protein [Verrucomicrobiae bacterium]
MSVDTGADAKNPYFGEDSLKGGVGFPHVGLFIVLFFAWGLLFHFTGNSTLGYIKTNSLFLWWYEVMAQSARAGGIGSLLDGEDALGWFIPLIVIGLLYWRRDFLAGLDKKPCWIGVLIVGFAVLLHVCGFLAQQTRLSVVAFFIGIYGITGVFWGWRWLRETLFIFGLFAFCVPLGGAADVITFPLRILATKLSVGVASGLFGLDIVQRGTAILDATGRYQYEVAPACGGIRSLTAIFALAIITGFVSFKSLWRRVVLAITALPLAVIGNVLRLLAIIFAAELAGHEAGAKVHESSFFSILPYLPAFVGFWILTGVLREPIKVEGRKSGQDKAGFKEQTGESRIL